MVKVIKLIPAVIGAALCIVAAFLYWPSWSDCGVHGLALVVFAGLGITELVLVILVERNPSPLCGILIWVIFGGLIAFIFVSVMSVVPWVLAVVLTFLAAVLLSRQSRNLKIFTILGILLVSSLLFFILFYGITTYNVFEKGGVPQDSYAARAFSHIDYDEAFRVQVPESNSQRFDIVSVTKLFAIAVFPCWKGAPLDRIQSFTFEQGKLFGHWKVFHKSAKEISIGFRRSFIDFRVSVLLSEENRTQWVTVATVVHYNNWKGWIYFQPVRFGHQIIFADIKRKMKKLLRKEKKRKM